MSEVKRYIVQDCNLHQTVSGPWNETYKPVVLAADYDAVVAKIEERNEHWRNIQIEEMGYTLREVEALGIDFQKEIVSDGQALHEVVMKRIIELRQIEAQLAAVEREKDAAVKVCDDFKRGFEEARQQLAAVEQERDALRENVRQCSE